MQFEVKRVWKKNSEKNMVKSELTANTYKAAGKFQLMFQHLKHMQ